MFGKIGRNDPCWCGSGKKYKVCHEAFDEKINKYARMGHIVPKHNMIKTPEQIEKIKESCKINIAVLDYVAEHIGPGVSTEEIDRWVHEETVRHCEYCGRPMTRSDVNDYGSLCEDCYMREYYG